MGHRLCNTTLRGLRAFKRKEIKQFLNKLLQRNNEQQGCGDLYMAFAYNFNKVIALIISSQMK